MAGSKTPAKDDAGKTVKTARPYEFLMQALQLRAGADGSSSFDIAANVIDQIAEAQTMDDIFAANESGPAELAAYLNTPLNITDIRVHKSAERFREGTLGVYVVFEGYRDGGDEFLLSTGAPNVVSSLFRAQQTGNLSVANPCRCQIKTRETANGQLYTLARAS